MRDLKIEKRTKVKQNRRKRERRPTDWKRIFRTALRVTVGMGTVALVGCGVVLAGRLLFDSNYFRIAEIRVENEHRVTAEEVLALSDIQLGVNIFELDLVTIGKKIEENPWVGMARVERIFPQEVLITVEERRPRAIVNLGYLYYLDASGEVFKVLEPQDGLDYPVITGMDRKLLLDQPEEAKRLLAGAVSLLERVEARKLFGLKDLSEIHFDPRDGYQLHTLVGGVPIRMGFDDFDSKLDRLEAIYSDLQASLSRLRYIDLNVADRVIVKVDTKLTRARI